MVDNMLTVGPDGRPHLPADRLIFELVTPPTVMLATIVGVLMAGRSTTSAPGAAVVALLWFGLLLAVGARIARRRPATRPALAIGYVLAAAVAVTLLGLPSLLDREVSELVATGTPLSSVRQDNGSSVELAAGQFGGLAHPGSGRAAVVEVRDGRRVLTFTDFATTNGPDLRVYLTSKVPAAGELGRAVDVGALKGNRGDQQYELPEAVDTARYHHVIVWSRVFGVVFTAAELTSSDAEPTIPPVRF